MLQDLLDTLRQLPPGTAYAVLFAGALLEYIVPPFPGDTVVLVAAALVAAFDWPVVPVLIAVTAGAIAGSLIDLEVGRWLARTGRVERLGPKKRKAVHLLVARFERHGAVYLVLNRFLPGIRAAFFVAAGLAGLSTARVVFWSTVSAVAWNGLLVGAGLWLGGNIEELAELVGRHNQIVGVVIVLVLAVVGWRTWRAVQGDDEE